MRKLTLLAAAALAATASAPAFADIVISDQQQVAQGQTIQFPVQPNDGSIVGLTNQTSTSVTFDTLTGQTLTSPSQGQARIEAVNGVLNSLNIYLTDHSSFGYIEFNLFGGNNADATTVTITGLDATLTPFTLVSAVGNGENFFSALATAGQVITSISFNTGSALGFTDIRQVRINTATNLTPVPEPTTWAMMLVGFGAAGIAMRRTRRRKQVLAQIA